jgi:hypothetical protein
MTRALANGPLPRAEGRINLPVVEEALRRVGREFEPINAGLRAQRDPLDNHLIDNMMAGYAFIDTLVADGTDVFAMGNLKNLLELNSLVLCGQPVERGDYAGHIAATERRFYEERGGGIEDVVEWYARHASESVWSHAAGLYTRILSQPQLFIEGNHRTGALVMSYLLVRAGEPPFVLSVANAGAYFDLSTLIRNTDKVGAAGLFALPGLRRRAATFLRDHSDRRYLLS